MHRHILSAVLMLAIVGLGLTMGLVMAPGRVSAATATPGVSSAGVGVIHSCIRNGISVTTTVGWVKVPFAVRVLGISAWTPRADLTNGNEGYQMEWIGSSVGNITSPLVVNSSSAAVEASIVNALIPDEEEIQARYTLSGTTPSSDGLCYTLTYSRRP